ncbi:hypothetical protein PJI16_11600 [Nitrospira sp. MA-1]|nr:hypothetical protein [Nitrospira sp. MA-1]
MSDEKDWLPTEKNIEDYELLKDMLDSQKREFDLLSKKKPDDQLNKMKLKMVNRVLEPLKKICENEPSYMFLDTLNEDEMPTYSDVVLIISQYETALDEFKETHHFRDDYRLEHRWMTQEYPPDYYGGEDEGDEGEE